MTLRDQILAEIRLRERRAQNMPAGLFGEPAWEMLLGLALDRIDGRRSSVSGAGYLTSAPQSTALRYVKLLINAGLAERTADERDQRRFWLTLTDAGMWAVTRCFETGLRAVA